MSHCKIMICDHFCQEFQKKFSQIILEEKLIFKCTCQNTYGFYRNLCFVCALNLINNQIKKYCVFSNYLSKLFDFYDRNSHTLSKFLKSLSFEDFCFYFSIYYNKIRIQQI